MRLGHLRVAVVYLRFCGLELGAGVVHLCLGLGHDGLAARLRAGLAELLDGVGNLLDALAVLVGVDVEAVKAGARELGHVVRAVQVQEVEGGLGHKECAAHGAAVGRGAQGAVGVEERGGVAGDADDLYGVAGEVGHAVGVGGGVGVGVGGAARVPRARARVARARRVVLKRDGVADPHAVLLGVTLRHRGLADRRGRRALEDGELIDASRNRAHQGDLAGAVALKVLVAEVARLHGVDALDLAQGAQVVVGEAVGERDLQRMDVSVDKGLTI